MDSKSCRVYNPGTRSVRESQNVVFIEAPSAMTRPDVGRFDEGESTYDEYDDMLRDVQNHTFNQNLSSSSPDLVVADP